MTTGRLRASVVIPAYNEEAHINECIAAVLASHLEPSAFEVIVVDNGSTDRTLEIVRAHPVKLLSKGNCKVGAVRNFGAMHAKGTHLVFLDSDCVVDPEWLSIGITRLEERSRLVLGGQPLLRKDPSWVEKYWVLGDPRIEVVITTLVGASIFIRSEDFIEVAGFDEELSSGEDSEFTERLRSAGFTVTIDPRLSVVHLGYPSRILPFLRRQKWHSVDYITNLPATIHDKVFLLTILFLFGCVGSVGEFLVSGTLEPVLLIPVLAPPLALSYKRISRSKTNQMRPLDLLSIYCVDLLYLVGRSWGVITSARNLFLGRRSETFQG